MIVIDASATIALLLNEDDALTGTSQLDDLLDEAIIAPSHWAAEVGNALTINVRRRRLKSGEIDVMTERVSTLGIQLEPSPSFGEIAIIARQSLAYGLTYYDAAYVHTALLRQASLFTFDRKMRTAASSLNVPLLPV